MDISPTLQLATALFWTLTALAGVVVTLPVLLVAHAGWRRLRHEGTDRGLTIMAWSHVQGDALRLLMHLSFLILGASRLLGPPFVVAHVASAETYWAGVLALMTVPGELIAVTLLSRFARQKVARLPPDAS